MEGPSQGKNERGERGAPPKGGKGGKGGHGKLQKWEAERRRRRVRQTIPLIVLVLGVVGIVAGAAMLSPPPPSGQGGPCDYPIVPMQHYHAFLRIYVDGTIRNVPDDIGVDPARTADTSMAACTSGDPDHGMSPVHTHAGEPNWLHIESRVARTYTLGDFSRVWGQPIGPDGVWDMQRDARHQLSMTVDGSPSGAWGSLTLVDGMQIRIDYITT